MCSEHFEISTVKQECTLEEFCEEHNIPFSRLNVLPEVDALKVPIAWKNARDVIFMDKVV